MHEMLRVDTHLVPSLCLPYSHGMRPVSPEQHAAWPKQHDLQRDSSSTPDDGYHATELATST